MLRLFLRWATKQAACRFEYRGDVGDYCSTAARHLAPGGVLALVFPVRPARQLERLFEAVAGTYLLSPSRECL